MSSTTKSPTTKQLHTKWVEEVKRLSYQQKLIQNFFQRTNVANNLFFAYLTVLRAVSHLSQKQKLPTVFIMIDSLVDIG